MIPQPTNTPFRGHHGVDFSGMPRSDTQFKPGNRANLGGRPKSYVGFVQAAWNASMEGIKAGAEHGPELSGCLRSACGLEAAVGAWLRQGGDAGRGGDGAAAGIVRAGLISLVAAVFILLPPLPPCSACG
jgi:hypothetical protein